VAFKLLNFVLRMLQFLLLVNNGKQLDDILLILLEREIFFLLKIITTYFFPVNMISLEYMINVSIIKNYFLQVLSSHCNY